MNALLRKMPLRSEEAKQKPPPQYTSVQRLWWAVIRKAAVDVVRASDQEALDALEFLWSTGEWLADELFGIPDLVWITLVDDLVDRRNRRTGRALDTFLLSRSCRIRSDSLKPMP